MIRLLLNRLPPLAICFLLLAGLSSLDTRASDWLMDAWRVEEGLPNNIVDAIAQTPDGYLWLGTEGGLARFDGVTFSPVDDARFKVARVRQLYVDRSGRLWVLGNNGEVAFIHEGEIKTFVAEDGVPVDGLQTPAEDPKGRVWFSSRSDHGCLYFDGRRFVAGLDEAGAEAGGFNYLAFDTDGALFGARKGELWKLVPGKPILVPDLPGLGAQESPLLCASRQGGFWMVSARECCLVRAGQRQRLTTIPFDLAPSFESAANFEDGQGRLWFAARQRPRFISIDTNGVIADQTFTARSNLNCRILFEDRQGNRWWSTGTDGIRRFRPRQLELVSDPEHLPVNAIISVAADPDRGVWALLGRGLVRITNNSSGEIWSVTNRVPFARSLWVDRDGTLFLGAERLGLYQLAYNRVQRLHYETDNQSLFSALFRDGDGDLLIGSPEGLHHLAAGDRLERVMLEKSLGPDQLDFRAFASDSRSHLYAGLRNAGLLRRDHANWTRLTNGMPGTDIAALWCDPEDTLWIGVTGHGLCRLRHEQLFSFQQTRARMPRNISGIVEDLDGFLWLSSSEGIVRVSARQLNALADGHAGDAPVRRFDRSDGLLSSQCAGDQQPVSARSSDGRVWFATTRGLYVIDPAKLSRTNPPTPAVIEQVVVDDEALWKRPLNGLQPKSQVLRVPPNNARIEFHFTSLSLTAARLNRFRFQLEGLNPDWVEAETSREIYYTRVPPGSYKFKVMACDHEGVWNENVAAVSLVVLPFWWQTAAFRVSMIASAGLLLFGGYRWRVRGLERERIAQQKFARSLIESQEHERRRIAGELHDSLGQNLLVVKNYAAMALKETAIAEKTRGQLQEISAAATASIDEVRAIARALRPYQLDRFGLTKTLEDMADLLGQAAHLQIKTEIENVDQALSAEAEINVYRIVQEWSNNVVKHARASTARLAVRKNAGSVQFTLEDNGVGFSYPAALSDSRDESSFGLANLRERVRLLGGTLNIETAPGKGTRLLIDIPLN